MRQRQRALVGALGVAMLVAAPWLGDPAAQAAAPPVSNPAAPTAEGQVPVPVPGTAAHRVLLVPGDTLWGLAQTYDTTVPALQRANGLGTSTLIEAGTWLIIPGRVVVQAGDTLSQIAATFGVSVSALTGLNALGNTVIQPGQVLWIPAPSSPAPTAPLKAVTAAANALVELAHLVQAEAGDQPFLGMVAVAAVVLNRVRAPGFPKTVAGVIFQPGQFDSVSNGTYWQSPSPAAYRAAQAALDGEDPTDGALYYYNPALTTNPWMKALPVIVTIGQQVFCR